MSASQRPVEELVHRLHTSAVVREPAAARSARLFRTLGVFALAFGVPSAIVGFVMNDALALAISAAFTGGAFLCYDVSRARRGGLSPITMYAFTWTLAAIGNAFAVLNQDTAQRPLFFIYAIDEHLPLAMKIAWLGLVVPVLGYYWVARSPAWQGVRRLLPSVQGEIQDRYLLPVGLIAAAIGFATTMTDIVPSLGTLTDLLRFLPHLATFTLARMGTMRKRRRVVWVALGIALLEAVRAAVFAYLRSDVVSPIFAYAAGVFLGAGSLRALRGVFMVPVYAAMIPFIAYFAAFADVRGSAGSGFERLTDIHEQRLAQIEAGENSRQNLLTRLSNINQLTQIGRVVDEDGFLGGETLEYLAYAWIPRFLWAEKPVIAKGAWFAYRIGQARLVNGRPSNSINMTIPGEFYLNFGWLGLFMGTFAFGGLLALLWRTTGFWEQRQNVLGAAFGFYLVWVGVVGGADLQIVITLIAVYLVFAAASITFRNGVAPVRRVSPSDTSTSAGMA